MATYYLCVLDFEATCWKDSKNKEIMEIIEFPSVLYKIDEKNKSIELVSEFSKYVKPTIVPILTDFCTELTGITQDKVDIADTIDIVYKEHRRWIAENVPASNKCIIATCGAWDLFTQLPREITNKQLQKCSYYNKFINVKTEFENFYSKKSGGMTNMLTKLNLPLIGRHHSGIDDTRNIAAIMLKMINEGHLYKNFTIKNVE